MGVKCKGTFLDDCLFTVVVVCDVLIVDCINYKGF